MENTAADRQGHCVTIGSYIVLLTFSHQESCFYMHYYATCLFEFVISQPQPTTLWYYMNVSSHLAYSILNYTFIYFIV